MIDQVTVVRPTRHKIGHFGDVLPSQSLGAVPEKLNLAPKKHTTQEQTSPQPKPEKPQNVKP